MKRRKVGPFAKIPLWWLDLVCEVCPTSKQVRLAIELLELSRDRLHWTGKRTVKLSTTKLAKLGITRRIKHRTLRALERRGLVEIERAPGRAPLVTVLYID
jgi:DNA-binding transcriptional ArsR family regulator